MNIKLTLTLLAAVVISLPSCKKSTNIDENSPPKKLKYLSKTITVQDGGTVINTYSYDNKNRVSGTTTSSSVNGTNSTTTYAYNGNDLFEVEIYSPGIGFRDVTEFSYASDKTIATARNRIYRNNMLNSDVTYRYYYANGKISEIKHDIYTDKYSYDSRGNVIKRENDEFKYTSEWTYDDKANPMTYGFPKYILNATINYVSPNNQVTRPPSANITYVYDADGYPTSAKSGTATTTYTYVEL